MWGALEHCRKIWKGLDNREICRASTAVHEYSAFYRDSHCKAPGVTSFHGVLVGAGTASGTHRMIQSPRKRVGCSLEGVMLNSSTPLHGKPFLERDETDSSLHRDLLSTLIIQDWFAVDYVQGV